MNTLHLPFYDHSGRLTPLVLKAMKNGAISSNHPTDPDVLVLSNLSDDEAALLKMSSPDPVKWIKS